MRRELESGVLKEAPREALACWGARATIRNGRWTIPHEQQDIVGPPEEREKLARIMNEDGILREAESAERMAYFHRSYSRGQGVCMVERPEVVVITMNLGSYIHVTAYTRRVRS